MSSRLCPLVAIVGPTASGKSGLALALAERFAGEIVNCDSMQIYRGFDAGTAKPDAAARGRVPHHLFDIVDAPEIYSAGDYASDARRVSAEIADRGRLPVVAGGTGFYFRAFLDGLPPLPRRDENLRSRLAAREARRPGSLHRLLNRLEPAAASRIHPRDTQKLTRALEIRLLTRRSLPDRGSASPLQGFRVLQIGLAPPRAGLIQVIAARTRRMFETGLVEEVRGLLASGLSGNEKPFESLGYKQALQYIRGELSLEASIESTEIETRQYAKRQLTWFRRDPGIRWIEAFGDTPMAIDQSFQWTSAHLSDESAGSTD